MSKQGVLAGKKVSLQQVSDAVGERAAAVTAETAGYVVLQVVRALAGRWASLDFSEVNIGPEGDLQVAFGQQVPQLESEKCLCRLLVQLLELARAPSPALTAIGDWEMVERSQGLESLLLAALVPLNEAAAKRGLSRLWRETSRYVERQPNAAAPGLLSQRSQVSSAMLAIENRLPVQNLEERQLSLFEEPQIPVNNFSSLEASTPQNGQLALTMEIDTKMDGVQWEVPSSRSNLRELIGGFLSEARSEERMARDLRRSIGLDD